MDSATEDLYFQQIEEFIKDEDKIVTIPYLSRSLKITIQDSEKLLSKYLKDQRKLNPNELAATYILKGVVKDMGRGVFFIKEGDLQEKKLLFEKFDSEVLFSVQKCKQIDFNVIALVDDVTKPTTEPLLGSIVSKNCVKRVLKVKKLPTPPPSSVKGKSSFFLQKTESSSSVGESEKPESKPKQNGLAGMFSKAAATQSTKDKDTNQKKTNTSKQPSNKGGLSAFLSKGSSNSSIKSENRTISKTSSSQPSEIEELMEIDFYEESDNIPVEAKKVVKEENNKSELKEAKKKEVDKIPVEAKKVVKEENSKSEPKEAKKKEVTEVKKQEGKEKKNKNKRQREKSEEKSIKKRKRIIQRNDSESDDMFENDEEDVIEKSDDEPEQPPSPIASKPLAPKNKIRKAVDNTYMDEEGFIVTKTEYIYESAPEEDEPKKEKEVKTVKLEKKSSVSSENDSSPKTVKNKKGKNNLQNQPTLMNFFKKK